MKFRWGGFLKFLRGIHEIPLKKKEIRLLTSLVKFIREGIEQEKKGYAENYEQGQVMEKNLISMAREFEKLRAEIANAEKRARAAAAAGTQGRLLLPKIVILSHVLCSSRLSL